MIGLLKRKVDTANVGSIIVSYIYKAMPLPLHFTKTKPDPSLNFMLHITFPQFQNDYNPVYSYTKHCKT